MADWTRIRKRLRENLMDLLQIFASEDDYVRNGRKRRHTKYGDVDCNNNLISDDQEK